MPEFKYLLLYAFLLYEKEVTAIRSYNFSCVGLNGDDNLLRRKLKIYTNGSGFL